MKKKLTFVLCFISFVFLSGCTSVIELSDDENRAIAEYSAELLLKYSISYESKYFEGEQLISESVSAETDTEADTEATEEITTTEPDDVSDTEEASETTEQAISYETDIAHAIGLTECSIVPGGYQITDSYPTAEENGTYIEASSGMKLLVVEFTVSNLQEEPVDLNLLDLDVDYYIVMNDSKYAKSMLTILMDDLSTYEATLAPGTDEKAVLVFQISADLVDQIVSLDVKVTYKGNESLIKIL